MFRFYFPWDGVRTGTTTVPAAKGKKRDVLVLPRHWEGFLLSSGWCRCISLSLASCTRIKHMGSVGKV